MVDLITEHIATWTGAQVPQTNGGRGRGRGSNGHSPHGIKKLRGLILELAVRGKLVPQDPKDEPVSVLLEKIAKEKSRLIKEVKIKKEKALPKITADEEPFELPEGWEVIRLGNITNRIGSGSTPRGGKSAYVESGIAFLRSQNIWNHGLELDDVAYISEETHQKMSNTVVVSRDILLNITGASLGRCAIYPDGLGEANVSQHVTIIRPTEEETRLYLHLCILSPYTQSLVWGRQVGMAREGLSKKVLELFEIPIPPLAEQHRIVAKVDELMALCDKLEQQQTDSNETHQNLVGTLLATLTTITDQAEFAQGWQRIEAHFDTLFTTEESIDQLKRTILQLAVMGKLVPQNPSDEPASILLEKIAKEKAKIIKEGKIKKQKLLPSIDEDSTPFESPPGWAWARFPELGEFGRGKSKQRPRNDPSLYSDGKYPMVQTGDVARADRIVKTYTALYNAKGLEQSRLWPKGTMCITIAANIADSGILGFDACFPDSVVGLIPSVEIEDSRYFEYFMRTAKENLMAFAPSTAQKNINLGILETVYIPLPPAEEIKRIVAKVDKLMTLCDTLKARLHDAQLTQVQLADAIVEQAVA